MGGRTRCRWSAVGTAVVLLAATWARAAEAPPAVEQPTTGFLQQVSLWEEPGDAQRR